jgi:hypothetical protein
MRAAYACRVPVGQAISIVGALVMGDAAVSCRPGRRARRHHRRHHGRIKLSYSVAERLGVPAQNTDDAPGVRSSAGTASPWDFWLCSCTWGP